MFEVGDRVVRKSNRKSGFISATEKRKVWMLEVRWDENSVQQWLPAEEFRQWDVSDPPPEVKTTPLGRTTPEYLVQLRLQHPLKKNTAKRRRVAEQQLADDLMALSTRKKSRSKTKADNLINKYNAGIYPDNMPSRLRTPEEEREHERVEAAREWKRRRKKQWIRRENLDKQLRSRIEREP